MTNPNDIAFLLAENEKLRAENKRLRGKYEGPFPTRETAKVGDIIGYIPVIWEGRGRPLEQSYYLDDDFEGVGTEGD